MVDILATLLVVIILRHVFRGWNEDTTDKPKGQKGRYSGLTVFVDHATGVHYVSTSLGGLTVRLKHDGLPWTETDDAAYRTGKTS